MWYGLVPYLFCLAILKGTAFHRTEIRRFEAPARLSCFLQDLETTPCRTMSYRERSWTKGPWGIVTVESSTTEGMRAWDRDRSSVESGHGESTEYYFFRHTWNGGRIIRRDIGQAFILDHDSKSYFVSEHALNLGTEYWEADTPSCEVAASHYLFQDWHPTGWFSLAGVQTIRYTGIDIYGNYHEIDFAPRFGCQPFKATHTKRNSIGLMTSLFEWEVTSYELGSPKPDLFEIPAGYARR